MWRARRDSNPRHLVPKTSALSAELRAPAAISPGSSRARDAGKLVESDGWVLDKSIIRACVRALCIDRVAPASSEWRRLEGAQRSRQGPRATSLERKTNQAC